MKVLNLKKDMKHLYSPSAKKVGIVTVPKLQFMMIDGRIEKGKEPGNSPSFAEATQALYSVAYPLKFMFKKRKTDPVDYPVMPLEGLWGLQDVTQDISKKDNWSYTLMILQPDIVSQDVFSEMVEQVRQKKGDSPALSKLRLEHFEEGTCVQVMHIGPYATEPATIEKMRAFALENGYRDNVGPNGLHHEIYIGDPRRSAPEKLKTVLRHPLKKVS